MLLSSIVQSSFTCTEESGNKDIRVGLNSETIAEVCKFKFILLIEGSFFINNIQLHCTIIKQLQTIYVLKI